MNKLEALRLFCAAAEAENFRQAAREHGLSPQAVTRAVSFLEQEFGEVLFVRNTRSTQITPLGEQVYRQAKAAVRQADGVFRQFGLNERAAESGLVRVDIPRLAQLDILGGVLAHLADHPGIVLDWHCGNQRSHTDRDQIDVGIRVGTSQENDFIVKNIAPLRLVNVAAPELLARLGEPQSIADLQARFPLLGQVNANSGALYSWDFADGSSFVPNCPVLIAEDTDDLLTAAVAGRAAGQFADWQVRGSLRSGRLNIILPEQTAVLPEWQMYVYRPNRHRHTARVRRVFDALAAVLEERLG